MKVLLTGSSGQLGQALISKKPSNVELIATSRKELNLDNFDNCLEAVERFQPDWIINSGAYTAVDNAEDEPELVKRINAKAPRAFADAIKRKGGKILQISTDFVFDGSQNKPYKPTQKRNPIGIYGRTKAKGEEAIENILFDTDQGYILRTSWVMGPVGRNFALTMLRLHQSKKNISVIADQVGSPTSTFSLASACWKVLEIDSVNSKNSKELPKILHWCDSGYTTWFDIAVTIGKIGNELGLISQQANVIPIKSIDFHSKAKRPNYSVLDCRSTCNAIGLKQVFWKEALYEVLQSISIDHINDN